MATDSKTDSTTSTTSSTTDLPPNPAEVGNQITSNLAAADAMAAQRVRTLAWVHQARAAQLSRTAASLKAQNGPDDPDAKSAESAAAEALATAAQVAVVRDQVTTDDPPVAPGGWVLQGRVLDAHQAPASGYTVFLVDSTKTFQQAYGFANTDNTGYFLLSYPPGGTTASGKTAPKVPPPPATPPDLFVQVADTKAQLMFLSPPAFQPLIGNATYQTIRLPAGQPPISDVPPDVRQVAIPKATKDKKS